MNKCYFCKKDKKNLDLFLLNHKILAEVCENCKYKIQTETKNTCYICGRFSDCSNLETENKKIKSICYLCSLKRLYKDGD